MRILVSGASGLVGSAVTPELERRGHEVLRLVRRPSRSAAEVTWDPESTSLDSAGLGDVDAVLHLAGENVASGRWTAARKQRIRDSRVRGTENLRAALQAAGCHPRTVVAASAIGFYGSRGSDVMTEASAPGTDFLAETCVAWEAASGAFAEDGCRVVRLRIGVVLSRDGGALARMLPAFRWGVGGKLGGGQQFFSWIALDDLVAVVLRGLEDESTSGPYNAVAPNPVTNAAFTATLGRVLRRPTILPVPAPVLRLLFGEMGETLLLSSTRVQPERLIESGHEFRFPELEAALRHLLGA